MKNKGITLVSLVITIIVLLLLAGITISLLLGDKGILGNAKEAKIETRGAVVEEQANLWKLANETAKVQGIDGETLNSILLRLNKEKQLTDEEVKTIKESAKKEIIIGSKTISFLLDNPESELPETTTADGKWNTEKSINKPKIFTSTGNSRFNSCFYC